MTEKYEPELGQALFGQPWGEYEVPDYGRALIEGLVSQIERVFWNREQREWDRYEDPKIPGLYFQAYWWGDESAPEASKPNLQVEGDDVEIRWYKHPGRGLSVNLKMEPQDWAAWFTRAAGKLGAEDERTIGGIEGSGSS